MVASGLACSLARCPYLRRHSLLTEGAPLKVGQRRGCGQPTDGTPAAAIGRVASDIAAAVCPSPTSAVTALCNHLQAPRELAGRARCPRPAHQPACRGGVPPVSFLWTSLFWVCTGKVRSLWSGFSGCVLMQGPRCLSVLHRSANGSDGCAPGRPCHSACPGSAVGDLRPEAAAVGIGRSPTVDDGAVSHFSGRD